MEILLGLTNIILLLALIIGLIKPSVILRRSQKPTRAKVFLYCVLGIIITNILTFIVVDTTIDANDTIELAKKNIEDGKYDVAINDLKKIEKTDSLYTVAKSLITRADSLNNITKEENRVTNEIKLKEQLDRELTSIDNGIKFADGSTVDELQMDIIVFATWASIINDADKSEDEEVTSLGEKLRERVSKIQIKEFPNLRRKYSKIVANLMWENDISVTSSGTGDKYINFTAGLFAANKNKKQFQTDLQEILNMFRFKQSRYRWYEGEKTYSYYEVFQGKDADLVIFN